MERGTDGGREERRNGGREGNTDGGRSDGGRDGGREAKGGKDEENRIELYFDHNHNVIYIQCKYTLTEYNKYIIVTVEILLKPQGAYNEDHQDMKNRH